MRRESLLNDQAVGLLQQAASRLDADPELRSILQELTDALAGPHAPASGAMP